MQGEDTAEVVPFLLAVNNLIKRSKSTICFFSDFPPWPSAPASLVPEDANLKNNNTNFNFVWWTDVVVLNTNRITEIITKAELFSVAD